MIRGLATSLRWTIILEVTWFNGIRAAIEAGIPWWIILCVVLVVAWSISWRMDIQLSILCFCVIDFFSYLVYLLGQFQLIGSGGIILL